MVLEGLVSESGVPLNKENIYLAKTSPTGVHKAYLEQFEKDFTRFLKLRSEELIPGGRMVLTFRGNQSKEDSIKNYCPEMMELIGMELQAMVSEVLLFHSYYVVLHDLEKFILQNLFIDK